MLSKKTKGKAGFKVAKAAAKRPQLVLAGTKLALPLGRAGLKASKPLAKASKPMIKRRARQRAQQIDRASRILGETLAVTAPRAAYELGLAEPPKPKRMAPGVAAGIVIGAGAMYFLEPDHGSEHREKVAQLVS